MTIISDLLTTPQLELDGQHYPLSTRTVYLLAGVAAELDTRLVPNPATATVELLHYGDADGIIARVGPLKFSIGGTRIGDVEQLCTAKDCDLEVTAPLFVCAEQHLDAIATAPYDIDATRDQLVPSRVATWAAEHATALRRSRGEERAIIGSALRAGMAPAEITTVIGGSDLRDEDQGRLAELATAFR